MRTFGRNAHTSYTGAGSALSTHNRQPDRRHPSSSPRDDREFVQALERGFVVIKAFSGQSPLTIADVAQRSGLARAVARRYLLTLVTLGCAEEHDGRFRLTPRVLDLG